MQNKDNKKNFKAGKKDIPHTSPLDMDTSNIASTSDYTGAIPSAPSDEQLESYREIFGDFGSYPAE